MISHFSEEREWVVEFSNFWWMGILIEHGLFSLEHESIYTQMLFSTLHISTTKIINAALYFFNWFYSQHITLKASLPLQVRRKSSFCVICSVKRQEIICNLNMWHSQNWVLSQSKGLSPQKTKHSQPRCCNATALSTRVEDKPHRKVPGPSLWGCTQSKIPTCSTGFAQTEPASV